MCCFCKLFCCCCGCITGSSGEDNNGSDAVQLLSVSDQDSPFPSPDTISLVSFDDSIYKPSPGHDNGGTNPQLECIIVPSYGKCPPSDVSVKIKAGRFLRGVGEDLTIIQGLIAQDPDKELVQVRLMCHFEQVKMAQFLKMIEDKMKDLRLKHKGSSQKGCKCIYYTIHM